MVTLWNAAVDSFEGGLAEAAVRFELLAHPSFLLLPILWRRLFLSDECLQGEFSVPQLKGKSKAPAAPVQFDFENVGATGGNQREDRRGCVDMLRNSFQPFPEIARKFYERADVGHDLACKPMVSYLVVFYGG